MAQVIASVVDDGEFMEYFALGESIICGFARVDGETVDIRQPADGLADIESSEAARFDAYAPFQHPATGLCYGFFSSVDQSMKALFAAPSCCTFRSDRSSYPDHYP